ncbi:fimbrial protein [Shewanella chilikensis]|uniref:fimbrial protein n=1 Tax=Shewanella chilikensis TaxID=558541 RepID=UPI001F1D4C22|nr:fimbrial protein [Shewanella chilikensis]MCE9789038.1 type 1 fimbrial protein [Shewanella chilikensis]
MKKIIILAVSLAGYASLGTANAASNGTINFVGEITGATCNATINGDSNATVTLPTISNTLLQAAGTTAGKTSFIIELSDCTAASTITQGSAYFESGTSVNIPTGRLKNTASTNAASNVTLQLRDGSSDTAIKVGDSSQASSNTYVSLPTTGNKAQLPYTVEYYAENAVTAGKVASSVVYSIQYK